MAKDLFIIGTSGQAKEVACLVDAINRVSDTWKVAGFISERAENLGEILVGRKIVSSEADFLARRSGDCVAIGIGHPLIRKKVFEAYSSRGFVFPNLVHPAARVDPTFTRLGQGNLICASAFVSCDVSIGDANLLNWNVTVGHDTSLGSFNVIHPSANISGNVTLGDGILVGVGSQILEGRSVGDGARIGAGAVVTRDVAPRLTVVGIPARSRTI